MQVEQSWKDKGKKSEKAAKYRALKLGIYYGSLYVCAFSLAHKHTEMCSGSRILYKSPFSTSNVLWMAAKMGLGEFHSPRSLWARHLWPDHDMSPLPFFPFSSGAVIGSWNKPEPLGRDGGKLIYKPQVRQVHSLKPKVANQFKHQSLNSLWCRKKWLWMLRV